MNIVQEMLSLTGERRIDVHVGEEFAFRCACSGGHTDIVELLLSLEGDRRVDVHAYDSEAFVQACAAGRVEVVRLLLSLDGDRRLDVHYNDERAFRMACQAGQRAVVAVRLLLELQGDRRIDVHVMHEFGFTRACSEGCLELVRLLLSLEGDQRVDVHSREEEGFFDACRWGRVNVVRELLSLEGDRRIDVHAGAERAFRAACSSGHLEVAKELLALTGDRRINVHAGGEEAAFIQACNSREFEVMRFLLSLEGDRRIDVHASDEAALRDSCKYGLEKVMCELLALPPDCGYTWDTPQQLSALHELFQRSMRCGTHETCVLLRAAPLPPSGLGLVFKAADRDAPAEALCGTRVQASMVQQVILYCFEGGYPLIARGESSTSQAQHRRDMLVLCATMPGLSDLGLWKIVTRLAGEENCTAQVQQHAKDVAWRGVAVPIVPAPGADGLWGREGGLRRAARRAMVLLRAAHIV